MRRALPLVFLLASCGSTGATIKDSAWSAGGAVAGAAVGSLAGPGGTLAGAAIGGGAGHLVGENSSLRSGELQGEGAAELWRGEAIKKGVSADYFQTWLHRVLLGAAAYFGVRNREHLLAAIKGRSLLPLLHSLIGGASTRKDVLS